MYTLIASEKLIRRSEISHNGSVLPHLYTDLYTNLYILIFIPICIQMFQIYENKFSNAQQNQSFFRSPASFGCEP